MRTAVRIFVTCLVLGSSLTASWADTPARPGTVRSKDLSRTQVLITWKDKGKGEAVYLVQRRRVENDRFITRAILPPNTTEFVDTVNPERIYVYRVVARGEGGEQAKSGRCFVNHPRPERPTTLAIRLIALTTARVTWADRSTTETGFRIERSAEGMPTFEIVGEVGPGEEEFIDRTLESATEYTYRIRALGDPRHCIKHSRTSREKLETSKGGVRVLEIDLTGSGSGYVVSIPEGINCGPARRHCSAEFPFGETVRLIPTPNGTSVFRRWEGDSLCNDAERTCQIRMGKDRAITARFRKPKVVSEE